MNHFRKNRYGIPGIMLWVAGALAAGCGTNEPIRHVVVDAGQSPVKIKMPRDRMLVALTVLPNSAWTFKVTGPISDVNDLETDWIEFLGSVDFSSTEKPKWELPDGWEEVPVARAPFAPHAKFKAGNGLEVAVSSLPPKLNIIDNVNRWRGQLGLIPSGRADVQPFPPGQIAEKPVFLVFDEVGQFQRRGAMGPMGVNHPPINSEHEGSTPSATPAGSDPHAGADAALVHVEQDNGTSPILYDAPEDWLPGKTSSIVAARFGRQRDGDAVEITVTRMPAERNLWLTVAKNWAAEIGVSGMTEAELTERTSDVTIDSIVGRQIRLVEPDEDELDRGVIGARIEKDDEAWFVKLSGARDLVAEFESEFRTFVESIRFK